MKKILLIQTAFLGDVILATSLLEKIHSCFPNAQLSFLVREGNESLVKNHPFLHEVLIWKKNTGKTKSLFHILSQVRKKRFDMVVNLQRFFASGLITACSGAPIRCGFNKNPMSFFFTHVKNHIIGDGKHEIERNAALIEDWCTFPTPNPQLYPSAIDFEKASFYKESPYVTMAPSSVWFTKQLPESKWMEMISVAPSELKIYLLGAPNDFDLCQKIIESSGNSNAVNLAGKMSLLQTAALMKDATMNYVNDSGPLHIASAMNAPVTAFFCSTIPGFGFGPLSNHYQIIETTVKLDCKPCGLHGKKSCPKGHFKCGLTITTPTLPFT